MADDPRGLFLRSSWILFLRGRLQGHLTTWIWNRCTSLVLKDRSLTATLQVRQFFGYAGDDAMHSLSIPHKTILHLPYIFHDNIECYEDLDIQHVK